MVDTCSKCGEPIIFRHVEGILKPIHLNGGWCVSLSSESRLPKPIKTVESYVNPNAYCPDCGAKVFFYKSRHGGRVFFDALGWPWPKHPCTDTSNEPLRAPPIARHPTVFKDAKGNEFQIYDLHDIKKDEAKFFLRFRNSNNQKILKLFLRKITMRKAGVEINDFRDAPSFLVRKDTKKHGSYRVEFISGRHEKILRFRMGAR